VNVTWWCSARTGAAWDWTPQAFPGIWLFVAAVLVAYLVAVRRGGATRGEIAFFLSGWLLLWGVLDWPVGALAAGWLLTAHMGQYVVISLVIVPLLENGMPDWMHRRLLAARGMGWARWFARRPFASFLLFNGVMIGTHLPIVTDVLKPLQFGNLLVDLSWIGAAACFWWSVRPGLERASVEAAYGKRLLYVAGVKVMPIFLGAFFVFADFPLYRTYELATRALPLSAADDQTIAGWLVWMGATPILLFRLGSAFFTWYELEA
jgi:cytochrome c oxidase assembly factor CtaG